MKIKRFRRIVSFLLIFVLFGNLGLGSWVQASENLEVESEELIKESEKIEEVLPIDEEVDGVEGQDDQEEEIEEDDLDESGLEEKELEILELGGEENKYRNIQGFELDDSSVTREVENLEDINNAISGFNEAGTLILDLNEGTINSNINDLEPSSEGKGITINLKDGQTLIIRNGVINGEGPDSGHEVFNISSENSGGLIFQDIKFTKHRGRILKIGSAGDDLVDDQTILMENVSFNENCYYINGDYLIESYVNLKLESETNSDLNFNNNETMLIKARGDLTLDGFRDINIEGNILSGDDAYNTDNPASLIYLSKNFIITNNQNLNIINNLTDKIIVSENVSEEKYYSIFGYNKDEAFNSNIDISAKNHIKLSGNEAGLNLKAKDYLKMKGENIEINDNREVYIGGSKNLNIKAKNLKAIDNQMIKLEGSEDILEVIEDEIVLDIAENLEFIRNTTSTFLIKSENNLTIKVGGSLNYINNLESHYYGGFKADKLSIEVTNNINLIGNYSMNYSTLISGDSSLIISAGNNLNAFGNFGGQGGLISDSGAKSLDKLIIDIGNNLNILKNWTIQDNLFLNLYMRKNPLDINILSLSVDKTNILGNVMAKYNDGGIFTTYSLGTSIDPENHEKIAKKIQGLNMYNFETEKYENITHNKALFLGNVKYEEIFDRSESTIDEIKRDLDYDSPIIKTLLDGQVYEYPNMSEMNLEFILNGGNIVTSNLIENNLMDLTISLSNHNLVSLGEEGDFKFIDFVRPGYSLKEVRLNGDKLEGYTSKILAKTLNNEVNGLKQLEKFNHLLYERERQDYLESNSIEDEESAIKDLKVNFMKNATGELLSLEDFSLDILNQAMSRSDASLEFIWEKDVETPGENPGGGGGSGGGGGKDKPSEPGPKEPEVKEPVDPVDPTKPISPEDKDKLDDYKKGDRSKRDSLIGMVLEPKIEYELNKTDHLAYLKGYKDNTIKPEGKLTRAEAAMVFYRLMEPDFRQSVETGQHDFKDIEANLWYSKPVATLANAGMLSGYKDGTFRPSQEITRAELSSMIAKLTDTVILPTEFSDIVEHWAEDYINSAQKAGWIQGYEDGSFKPDDLITRSEFTTISNSLLERKVLRENILPGIKGFKDLDEGKWYYEIMVEAINGHEYKLEEGIEIWTKLDHREFE